MNDQNRQHLDQLKGAADPERVAEALGLQRRGRRFFCPACQPEGGKSPDLSTTADGFTCFKCGAAGDVFRLVMMAGGMEFPAAVAWLEDLGFGGGGVEPAAVCLMPQGRSDAELAVTTAWLEPECRRLGVHFAPRHHVAWFGHVRGT